MSKLIRNLLIIVAATIGFITVLVSILYFLGFDIPCINDCKCACSSKKYPSRKTSSATPVKVKRHYTKLVLSDE